MSISYNHYLTKSALIKPLRQGELDNLSGLYSIINAIRWVAFEVRPISQMGAKILMEGMLLNIENRYKLSNLMTQGLNVRDWVDLAHKALEMAELEFGLNADIRYVTNQPSFAQNISNCLDSGSVVLTRLKGKKTDYSVIVAWSAPLKLLHS